MHRVNPEKERAASSATSKKCYQDDLATHRAAKTSRYHVDPEHLRAVCRHSSKEFCAKDPKHARTLARHSSKEFHERDYEHARAISRCSSKASYEKDKEYSQNLLGQARKNYAKHRAKRTLSKKISCRRNPLNKLVASARLYTKTLSAKSRANRAYYAKRRNTLCALRRDKYALAEPLHNRKVAIQRIL